VLRNESLKKNVAGRYPQVDEKQGNVSVELVVRILEKIEAKM
jgi:hypothetical protein